MSPICREHGHAIFTRSSTSSSYLHPSYFAFSSQTNTFVQINFSNPAVCYVMVCLQQPSGPIWISTEMQDLSKQFHSLTNYLHHPLVTPVTPNKRTNLISCCLHCLCFFLMPTPDTFCGYRLLQHRMCLVSEISSGHYLLYCSLINVLHLHSSDN